MLLKCQHNYLLKATVLALELFLGFVNHIAFLGIAFHHKAWHMSPALGQKEAGCSLDNYVAIQKENFILLFS